MNKETRKYEPWIIPGYGCASISDRGNQCGGSQEIDRDKYCKKCLSYDKSVISVKKDGK